jgi:hypothetical protein
VVVGGRRALFVEFVGSRKALLVVIVWIKSLCVVVSGLGGWQGLLVAVFGCFEGRKAPFVEFVGSRKALLVVIVWIKALSMVVVVVLDVEPNNSGTKARENSAILAANSG